jgi:hypothetical protein
VRHYLKLSKNILEQRSTSRRRTLSKRISVGQPFGSVIDAYNLTAKMLEQTVGDSKLEDNIIS